MVEDTERGLLRPRRGCMLDRARGGLEGGGGGYVGPEGIGRE